jgi:hypothetical protein
MNTLEKKNPSKTEWSFNIGAEDLRRRKARLNPQRVCTVPGCSMLVSKENIGTLCTKHHWRQREAGHAWHPIPRGKQRKASRQTVVRYLDEVSKSRDAARLLAFIDIAVNKLREPVSNALKPAQIRREAPTLTTKGKSQIVWAWLSKRKDFERLARRLLIEAMTLEVWAKCFYEDQRARLPKLLHTTVGRTAVWCSHIKETKTRTVTKWITRSCYPASEGPTQKITVEEPATDQWRPTPFVRVTVGKRVFTALREVLPTDWVTDQMIAETLRDYQSMEDQPK